MKVISEFHIDKYAVLILDEEKPVKDYYYYLIDGKLYKPVIVYDAQKCVAVESDENFLGRTIEFV